MTPSQKKWIALGNENLGRGSHRYPKPLKPTLKEKIAPPCERLAVREREREREKLSARGGKSDLKAWVWGGSF